MLFSITSVWLVMQLLLSKVGIFAGCFDFLSVSKPVHVITVTVFYLLLVLFREVVHLLAELYLATNSLASSTVCCTPLLLNEKFQLLWVFIIDLMKHSFIKDVCVVLMGTSIWTILCPVIYALTNCTFCWHSIYIGDFCHGSLQNVLVLMASSDLLYLGWKVYDLD